VQTPNDEGTGGPQNDGNEECDGTDGVGPGEACSDECILTTPTAAEVIPTMNEWGMIIFMMLAGAGAAYYLRRRRITG
jgi:hypothetical protein